MFMYVHVCACLWLLIDLSVGIRNAVSREFYLICLWFYSVDPIVRVATINVVANNPIKFYAEFKLFNESIELYMPYLSIKLCLTVTVS